MSNVIRHGKNTNEAPWPEELAQLVEECSYRPGWLIQLAHRDRGQGSIGLTLRITTLGYDSYHPENGETYRVHHFMPVPPAAYDRRSWQRWLFEQFLLVERHEACEFFKIGKKRPYAPHHGPGNDPYIVFDHGTGEDTRTMFTGDVLPDHIANLRERRKRLVKSWSACAANMNEQMNIGRQIDQIDAELFRSGNPGNEVERARQERASTLNWHSMGSGDYERDA